MEEVLRKQSGEFEVVIYTDESRGYFEHDEFGDEFGGELIFNSKKELVDFDGVYALPQEVRIGIINLGYKCSLDMCA